MLLWKFVLANAIETCIPPVLRKKTLWISYGRAFEKISFYVRCVLYPILSPKIFYLSKSCLLTSHAREWRLREWEPLQQDLQKGGSTFVVGSKQGGRWVFTFQETAKWTYPSITNKHNKTILTKRIESSPTLREGWGRRNGGDRPGNYKMNPSLKRDSKVRQHWAMGKGGVWIPHSTRSTGFAQNSDDDDDEEDEWEPDSCQFEVTVNLHPPAHHPLDAHYNSCLDEPQPELIFNFTLD